MIKSLAGILVLVVSLSTVAVTFTFRRVLLTEKFQQQLLEDRHPLSGRRRRKLRTQPDIPTAESSSSRLLLHEERSPQRPLHYLSFGSSNTWGAGLPRNETTTSEDLSYPYLLDQDALSVAIPSGHAYADLAAACTQTMVVNHDNVSDEQQQHEEEEIDVITIEYYSDEFTESHVVLTQRLRRRFPAAAIVLVQLWQPAKQLLFTPVDNRRNVTTTAATTSTQSFSEWRNLHQAPQTTDSNANSGVPDEEDDGNVDETSDAFLQYLVRSMLQAAGTWRVSSTTTETEERIANMIQNDGLLLHYRLPSSELDFTTGEDFETFLRLFNYHEDATVLSALGHAMVAQAVQTLVKQVTPLPIHHPLAGNWGSGDDCHVWYATGNYNLESTGRRVNLPLVPEDNNDILTSLGGVLHKHALEFDRRSDGGFFIFNSISDGGANDNNKITVRNPFDHDRMLSLTYLTDADSMSYPRTRVVLNGTPTVLLQPFHDADDDATTTTRGRTMKHMARTSGVGFIPPGTTTILLEPLQSTKLPFRLLGASLLAEEVQDLPSIEFALESDSLESAADDDAIVEDSKRTTTTGYLARMLR